MANSIKGTNIAAPIAPFTDADKYPTHSSIYGKGGYKSVKTIADMNAIPASRLEDGCVCYVVDVNKAYRYVESTHSWIEDSDAEENFVMFNDVFLGGAYIDEDGDMHMPTASYDEESESITIK